MKKVFLLFLLSIFAVSAHAQVQVKARASKTNLSTNDRMAVRFDVKIRSNNVNLEHLGKSSGLGLALSKKISHLLTQLYW